MSRNTSNVSDVTPSPTEEAPVKTDAGVHTRLGWWLVLGGMGAFAFWAFLAPLDQGVPMAGNITVAGNKKAVQHQLGGTIENILVKEGDVVEAGQPLVQMNKVQASTNAEITRIQFVAALSAEARLHAERDGLTTIAFPAEVQASSGIPQAMNAMLVQQQLFSARQGALRSELAAIDENVAGLVAHSTGIQQSRDSKREQLLLLKEQVDNLRALAAEGFVPRNRLLDMERTYAQLAASVSEDTGNLGRIQRQMSELKLRQLQRQQDVQKEVRSQLADVQKEAQALRARLASLEYEVASAEVKAPVSGIVADVNVFTEGGVVPAGFRMMDILPLSEPLIIEGQVPTHLIDSVHPQLPVELILSAYNQNTTPRIPAVVTSVSPDHLIDERTGIPYYRMRAAATAEGMVMMKNLQVRPGMPVELFVKTGERTLANYLIRPLRDNFRISMTEE